MAREICLVCGLLFLAPFLCAFAEVVGNEVSEREAVQEHREREKCFGDLKDDFEVTHGVVGVQWLQVRLALSPGDSRGRSGQDELRLRST